MLGGVSSSPARKARRHPNDHVKVPIGTLEGEGVVIAYLHPGQVAGGFMSSVTGLIKHDVERGRHRILGPHGGILEMSSGPRVAEARSQLVEKYLADPRFRGSGWMLMVDSDMTFAEDSLERLIRTSKALDADVVGGLCFAGGRSTIYPTIYRLRREEGELHVETVPTYPEDQPVSCGATGAAFILVRKRVFVAMMRPHPEGFGTLPDGTPNTYPWFVEGHVMAGGKPLGEDIAFCIRVKGMGGSIVVDTSIKVGHVKTLTLDEDLYREVQAKAVHDPDGPSSLVAPVAEEHD